MYQEMIRQETARQGFIGTDPRHIEAFMRVEYGCLDGLSQSKFRQEIKTSIACIREGGVIAAESLAKSFGL
jgi:hypothetical protein